jgi:hypothetical protein
MKLTLLMVVVLAMRAIFAPSLSFAPSDARAIASLACESAATTADAAAVCDTSDASCCDGACLCCMSAPTKKAPAEPMTPSSVDGPLRGVLSMAADVGQPVVPGLAIVTPRVVWPREWADAMRERPVSRDAAAVLCVWRT